MKFAIDVIKTATSIAVGIVKICFAMLAGSLLLQAAAGWLGDPTLPDATLGDVSAMAFLGWYVCFIFYQGFLEYQKANQ